MGEHLYERAPGRIRQKAKPGPEERMESLRETRNTPKGLGPRRIGEIELGSGEVEIGYDEKQRRLHLAILREEHTGKARSVVESSAARRRAGDLECGSNDARFQRGAVDLRAAPDQEVDKLLRELRREEGRKNGSPLNGMIPWGQEPAERGRARGEQYEKTLADELRSTVEPFWRIRRSGEDLLLLLKKKRREEEQAEAEEKNADRPAGEEHKNPEKRS